MDVKIYLLMLKVTVLLLSTEVSGKGRIAVQLVSYNNSRGLDITGRCCDGVDILGCPTGQCDHVFDICVRDPPGINSSTDCTHGSAEINAGENKNVIQFGEGKSLFGFDIWQGGVEISIKVYDTDSGDVYVPVDRFTFVHYSNAADYNSTSKPYDQFNLSGARSLYSTNLTMNFKVYCDPHYYGADCSINCVADNSCTGHYNCDSHGNKVCLPGWEGPNCDRQIPGGEADCSVYQNPEQFVPSLWEGYYRCVDDNVLQHITLNVTLSQGSIGVDGQLEIGSFLTMVSGSYGSLSKTLTLDSHLNVPQFIGSRQVTSVEINGAQINSTLMGGQLRFNGPGGVRCDVTLNRREAYFSGCNFQGTCIRYGQKKDEFYCCCNSGTVGQFCNVPTLSPPTSTYKRTTLIPTTSSPPTITPTTQSTTSQTSPSTASIAGSTSTTAASTTTAIPSTSSTLSTKISTASTTISTPTTSTTTAPTTSTKTTPVPTFTTTVPTTSTESTSSSTTATTAPTTTNKATTKSTLSTTMPSISSASTSIPTTTTTIPSVSTKSTTPSTTISSITSVPSTTISTTATPSTTSTAKTTNTPMSTSSISSTNPTKTTQTTSALSSSKTTSTVSTTSKPTMVPSSVLMTSSTTAATTVSTKLTTSSTMPAKATSTPTKSTSPSMPTISPTTPIQSITSSTTAALTTPNESTTRVTTSTTTPRPTTQVTTKTTTQIPTTTTRSTTEVTTRTTTSTPTTTPRPTTTKTTTQTSHSTTTQPQKPINPNEVQQLILELVTEELEDDKITSSIINAWINAAKERPDGANLNSSLLQITDIKSYDAIGDDGVFISVLLYNISLTSNIQVQMYKPSVETFEKALHAAYLGEVKVYRGVHIYPLKNSFQFYVYGPPPNSDVVISLKASFFDLLESKCTGGNCDNVKNSTIILRKTEEYIGDKGIEITKLYIFVEKNGSVVERTLLPSLTDADYEYTFRNHSVNIKVYTGTEKLRYRWHYDLFVKGYVFPSDHAEFEVYIQEVWYQKYSELVCRLCNISVIRTEEYVGDNGEILTSIIYYFRLRQTLTKPVSFPAPLYQDFNSSLNISNPDGKRYELYAGQKHYRYRHRYSLLITDKVDMRDRQTIITNVKDAWNNLSFAGKVDILLTAERTFISVSGEFVTELVCFVSHNGVFVDARVLDISTNLISQWMSNNSRVVSRRSSQMYVLYTGTSSSLIRTDSLFTLYINGYVFEEDKDNITTVIKKSWSTALAGEINVSISILRENMYFQENERRIVTGLVYAVYRRAELLKSSILEHSTSANATLSINSSLVTLTRKYEVHIISSLLLEYREHFQLYLTTKVATFQLQQKFKQGLFTSLKIRWEDYHWYGTSLRIHIAYQEKVYASGMNLWRVVYFLSYNNRQITRSFVKQITETTLQPSFNVSGLKGVRYQLYTGQLTGQMYFHSSSYGLLFSQQISKLDWIRIQDKIKNVWCQEHHQDCQGVSVLIKEQEKYLDNLGIYYWKLIYFISTNTKVYDSRKYMAVKSSSLDFNWTSVYQTRYKVVLSKPARLWRYYYGFNLYSQQWFSVKQIEELKQSLLKAWYNMSLVSSSCNCLEVDINRQRLFITDSGERMWQLTYFITYKSTTSQWLVDSNVWPSLNLSLLHLYTSTNFKSNIDLYYYENRFKFYSTMKISTQDYSKIERQMLIHWLNQTGNTHYKNCGCVSIKIQSQEEIIDQNGKSHWLVHFHIKDNRVPLSPSVVQPFKWSLFNKLYPLQNAYGYNYSFTSQYTSFQYNRYSYMGGLYLKSWIPPKYYWYFKQYLTWYYSRYYGGNVTIETKTSTKHFFSTDGYSVWQLPFILKVNGKVTYPAPFNLTELQAVINVTTPSGDLFKIENPNHVTDSRYYFSFHVNHKVSHSVYHKFEEVLRTTLLKQHPEWKNKTLKIAIGNQEEVIINGKTSWKLYYTLTVDGKKFFTTDVLPLDVATLGREIKFSGPNSVGYTILKTNSSSKVYSSKKVFSLYLDKYVSPTDNSKIQQTIKEMWKGHVNVNSTFNIAYVRQKKYIDVNGRVFWKWDYALLIDNSTEFPDAMPKLNSTSVTTTIANITSVTGNKYTVLNLTSSVYHEYNMHFPIYLSQKVAKSKFDEFKAKITAAWKKRGHQWKDITIDITSQEELVKENGESVWKLVYFLRNSSELIDSRVTQHLNISGISSVTGPRGEYRLLQEKDLTNLLQYSYSGSFYVNNKLDTGGMMKLQTSIKKSIEEKNIDLRNLISVQIKRQEEYVLKNGSRAWKIVFFVKTNGAYIPASSLGKLNMTFVKESLNFTGPQEQKYELVEGVNINSYRKAFVLHFETKVAAESYETIRQRIKEAWKRTKTEYRTCACLDLEVIQEDNFEEVIDKNGKSYWQLIYFLKANNTIVESMTHVPLNISHMNSQLANVTSPKKKAYRTVDITNIELLRIKMAFKVNINLQIGYKDKSKFEKIIKQTWVNMQQGAFNSSSMDISVSRCMRYIDTKTRKSVWQVEYFLTQSGQMVDPMVLPKINTSHLESKITFKNPRQQEYMIVTASEIVDYRWHYQVFLRQEVKETDFTKFETAVSTMWSKFYNTTSVINVMVLQQEEYIDTKGHSLWKLVTFVKKEKELIDSEVTEDLDITLLQSLVNFTNINNSTYRLETQVSTNIRRYDSSFSFFLSKTMKRNHIKVLENKLGNLWNHSGLFESSSTIVDVRKQELYLSVDRKMMTKVMYFLSVNGNLIDSSQLPETNNTELKSILTSISTTHQKYTIKEKTTAFRYSQQFFLLLTEPLLDVDIRHLQQQLSSAWSTKMHGKQMYTVEILYQDEVITSGTGTSGWKVIYSVKSNETRLKSTQESEISQATLEEKVNLTKKGTTTKYTHLIDWKKTVSLTRYQGLFPLHVNQRVDKNDYNKFSEHLKNLWNSRNITVSDVNVLEIIKQERVIDKNSNAVWKLSYKLQSVDPAETVNSLLYNSPSFNEMQNGIKIANRLGKTYDLVDVEMTYRMTQVFRIAVNRRLYKSDVTKFHNSFAIYLKSTEMAWTEDSGFSITKEEHAVSTKSGNDLWVYEFVTNVSGVIIDASRQPAIDTTHLQHRINFTSPRNEMYNIEKAESLQMFSDQFELSFKGRLSADKTELIQNRLKMHWRKQMNTSEIVSIRREEYIAKATKETVTKYSYFLIANGAYHYPSLTPSPNMSLLASNLSLTLSTGEVQLYKDCYKLYLVNQQRTVNQTAITSALKTVWKSHVLATNNPMVQVTKMENYVGKFGIRVLTILYTVSIGKQMYVPNFYVEPDSVSIENATKTTNTPVSVYGHSENIYRTSVLYHFNLLQLQSTEISLSDKVTLETSVKQAWKSNSEYANSVINTVIVYHQQYISSMTNNMTITKLFYSLSINTSRVESWQNTIPGIETQIHNEVKQMPSLRSKYNVTIDSGFKVRSIYISKTFDEQKLQKGLLNSWKEKVGQANNVEVKILSSERYASITWNKVFKVKYTVNVAGNNPDDTKEPSYEEIETKLKQEGLSQCGCKASKLRKKYVFGKASSLKYSSIRDGLTAVWRKSNTGSKDVSVRVHAKSTKRRRDTSSPSVRLVDNNGNDIAPLEYGVSVLGQEPDAMFVVQPNDTDVYTQLRTDGAEPCMCEPKLAGNVELEGETKDSEKSKIADAIKDAFTKTNPGVKSDDLEVEVTNVNNGIKDKDGKPISDVAYRVGRKDGGDVEELIPPTSAQLEKSLSEAGKTLHSRAPPEPEESNWKLIVAIVCGIVGLLVICMIIGYAIYMTRRSRKEDLLDREDKVYNQNKFDTEHFSDPAMYENPAYNKGSKDTSLDVL